MSGHGEDTSVAACRGVYGHEARATHGQRGEIPLSFPYPRTSLPKEVDLTLVHQN
jgi:hypothetical protein